MVFNFTQLAFLLLGVLLSACQVQNGKESVIKQNIKLLISVNAGEGQAKASRFSAELFSGRKMLYQGFSRMPVLGHYAYFIPEELPINLIKEAQKLKINELPDSLASEPDEQRIRIFYLLPDGKTKKISAGSRSAPANFLEFYQKIKSEILEMVNNQQGEKIP